MTQPGDVRIRRAILSVTDKTGVVEFARGLADIGVELVSTGGTASALAEAGLSVRPIEDFTGFPEIMGGRVKTLHPKLYAGVLALRDDSAHMAAADEHEVEFVDLVCVNLYPFEAWAGRRGVTEHEVLEHIDIGGPTMIRAAAKNFAFTAVVVKPESYDAVLQELRDGDLKLSLQTRENLAAEAFAYTARYDTAISRWFAEKQGAFPELMMSAYEKVTDLSYGENPHQRAAYYSQVGARMHVLSMVRQISGKELSFNNVLDINSGRLLVQEFEVPACAIIKHNNPCGAAVGGSILEAYERAFATDPLSAFGGVICVNRTVDEPFAPRARQAVLRGDPGAAFHRRGDRGALHEEEHAHPRGQRAAAGQHRRVGRQARDRRPARAGPRHGPRGPHGDGGRHRAQAVRGRVGRDAVRLEGLQARALERDRARSRPGVGGDRRGADEPRRLGAAGDREGARDAGPPVGRARWRQTRSSRSRTGPSWRSTPASRRSSSRAARCATTRSSRPPTPPASRWFSRTAATSSTSCSGAGRGRRAAGTACGRSAAGRGAAGSARPCRRDRVR